MLALPATSRQPGSSVRGSWGRIRRSLPLGNFFFAMTWISLIVSIVFFIVTWVTVFSDVRSDLAPANISGVSAPTPTGQTRC